MDIAHFVTRDSPKSGVRFLQAAFGILLAAPLRNPRMWSGLAWMDIVQSYRRTVLGPAWITLNLVIFIVAMTLVYGALFSVPTREYTAFICCGLIAWLWIASLLTEVGNTFLNYGHFIKGTTTNKAFFVWAAVYKQLIVLAHHMIVYAALVLIGIIPFTVYSLAFIPVVIVMFITSIPLAAIIAILFTRYRDLSRLVSSVTVVLLMVTPIFWLPHMLTGWRLQFVHLNPFYYLVEFMRTPLLGQPLDLGIVAVVLAMAGLSWIIGAAAFYRYQKYVVFWL